MGVYVGWRRRDPRHHENRTALAHQSHQGSSRGTGRRRRGTGGRRPRRLPEEGRRDRRRVGLTRRLDPGVRSCDTRSRDPSGATTTDAVTTDPTHVSTRPRRRLRRARLSRPRVPTTPRVTPVRARREPTFHPGPTGGAPSRGAAAHWTTRPRRRRGGWLRRHRDSVSPLRSRRSVVCWRVVARGSQHLQARVQQV